MCERIDLGNGNFAIICGGHRRGRERVKFPATKEELKAEKWRHKASRNCRLCETPLEFWLTPKGKLMPLEPAIVDNRFVLLSHWATCPHAEKFRKPKSESAGRSLFD